MIKVEVCRPYRVVRDALTTQFIVDKRFILLYLYRSPFFLQVEHMPRRIRAATDKFVHRISDEGPISMAKSTVARISLKPAITATEYKVLKSAHEILARVTPNVERITKLAIDREESWTGQLGHKLQRSKNIYNTVIGNEPKNTDECNEDSQP